MPQVKELIVFTVNELSESARDRAYFDWCGNDCYPWHDENIKALYKFADIAGIKINNFEYGGGVPFIKWSPDFNQWRYEDEILNLSGSRLCAYLNNNILEYCKKGKYGSTSGVYIDGKYQYKHRYSKCLFEYDNCPLTGYCADNCLIDPILDYVRKKGRYSGYSRKQWESVSLEDILDNCCNSWVKSCDSDYEDATSMQAFIDSCEANGYTFTESGRMENI